MHLSKAKKALCGALIVCALCSGAAGISASRQVKSLSAAEIVSESDLKISYRLGDTVVLPNAILSDGEKTYTANKTVITPKGNAYVTDTLTATEEGQYTVRYTATRADGRVLIAEKTFEVIGSLFTVGANSSAEYTANGLGKDGYSGLQLSLAKGESFRYNKAVNVSGKTASETVLSLFPQPETIGQAEASKIYVDFIDAYDASNYVRLSIKASTDPVWHTSYSSAAFGGGPTVGLFGGGGDITIDGERYTKKTNDDSGCNTILSFTGETNTGFGFNGKEVPLQISWDYANKRIYNTTQQFGGLVSDLDDPALYNELWQGFTTGEVYVSISADGYLGSTMRLSVVDLFGEDLSLTDNEDTVPPVIAVDYGDYAKDSLPTAQVGKRYTAFSATAYDVYDTRAVDVTVKAYYNYGTASAVQLTVKDGYFVPDREGAITLEYTAKDYYGNRAVQTCVLEAKAAQSLAIRLADDEKIGHTGESVKVKSATCVGTYDEAALAVEAVLVSDPTVRYAVDKDTFTFTPLYAGEYDVVYTCKNYIESAETTDRLTVEAGNLVLVNDEAAVPRYFIKNAAYTLPDLYGYNLSTGKPVRQLIDIYVSEDGGAERKVDGAFTVTASKTVKVIYRADSQTQKTYEVPVADVGYGGKLDMKSYLVSETLAKSSDGDGVTLTANQEGTHKVSFINAVLAEPAVVKFSVMSGRNSVKWMTITLTDSEDASVKLTVTYRASTGKVTASADGKTDSVAVKTFYNGTTFQFEYDDKTKTAYADRSNNGVTKVVLPESFHGFPSQKVYIDVEASYAQGAAIRVEKINNQTLNNATTDDTLPELLVRSRRGSNPYGVTITLEKVLAADVLDPSITFAFQVTDPNRKSVTDTNGVLLDGGDGKDKSPTVEHTIVCDQYGQYTVKFWGSDTSDNPFGHSYVISVVDTEGPQIVLSNKTEYAKVGDSVRLADYAVSDNRTEEVQVSVFVLTPEGKAVLLQDGVTAFKASRAGRYTVTYYAKDGDDNVVMVSYDITVR